MDSLAVDLAGRDLEREANERYKGFVVRTRLIVSNEAVKRILACGRNTKVSPSVHQVRQVPGWARATVES